MSEHEIQSPLTRRNFIRKSAEIAGVADREKALRYAMTSKLVDAVVVGFGSRAEVDEAIERVNHALNG